MNVITITEPVSYHSDMDLNQWQVFRYDMHSYGLLHRRLPDIQVTWSPPGKTFLRYQALYRGIYEYLREAPESSHRSKALRYLCSLKACYNPTPYKSYYETLQWHRILWTEAWLDSLEDVDSDAETVVGDND
jgi:hypothetical protein